MGLVAQASASRGAAARGVRIPGNAVPMVFRNDFAVRMLQASVPAGIEAPLRLCATEQAGGAAKLNWRTASAVFAPYANRALDEAARELATLLVAGHPWSNTWGVTLWGATAAVWPGWQPAGSRCRRDGWPSEARAGDVLADTISMMELAVMLGAWRAAAAAGHFAPIWRMPWRSFVPALAGGPAIAATGCTSPMAATWARSSPVPPPAACRAGGSLPRCRDSGSASSCSAGWNNRIDHGRADRTPRCRGREPVRLEPCIFVSTPHRRPAAGHVPPAFHAMRPDAAGPESGMSSPSSRYRLVGLALGLALSVVLVVLYQVLRDSGTLQHLTDVQALHETVDRLGAAGPAAVVGLMALAILVSPVPSAPIALAAGAAYGHGWGTLYVLIGAQVGALAAFGLARLVGRETVHRWFGSRLAVGLAGSQTVLMGLVFVSRLLPFVSFDIISYAAGLTVLSFWRFALATLAGIAPSSFLLAHFGSEMAVGDAGRFGLAVLLLGALTVVPLAVRWVWRRRRAARREQV